ncbi:hypothetical protein AJ80_05216 [Polytolypa hystricis UAMH7299]|uniref:Endosomal/vacuolar adapter protein YPT35 n=1 Tax=Polytolypa hystricis (strain UAMH7299) TaxID=1447883 RepID=A0A2B7Y4F7_POLH7|nr:hypothetical protein AJ80_05216 [Polytolypa hystricis UAMH7299]
MEAANEAAQPPPLELRQDKNKSRSLASMLFNTTTTTTHDSAPGAVADAGTDAHGTAATCAADNNDPTGDGNLSSSSSTADTESVVPPYWRHYRSVSQASQTSLDAAHERHITLEDHTQDSAFDSNRGLWAKGVTIDDHVVVKGKSGIGSYVVWICRIQTMDGGPMVVRMRYSEFADLQARLADAFPHAKKAMPPLPPKSAIFKFNAKFLEARRVGLAYFLKSVLHFFCHSQS